jgi:hypothetical protein
MTNTRGLLAIRSLATRPGLRRVAVSFLIVCAAALAGGWVTAMTGQDRPGPDRARLVGLDAVEVEARIGPPAEKNELADSNEAYWIYKTLAGTLSVHFENALVIDIDPADFPVETLLRRPGE